MKIRDSDDRRVDWLSFKNINQGTDDAKNLLIDMGMVKDEPGWISKLLSVLFLFWYRPHIVLPLLQTVNGPRSLSITQTMLGTS